LQSTGRNHSGLVPKGPPASSPLALDDDAPKPSNENVSHQCRRGALRAAPPCSTRHTSPGTGRILMAGTYSARFFWASRGCAPSRAPLKTKSKAPTAPSHCQPRLVSESNLTLSTQKLPSPHHQRYSVAFPGCSEQRHGKMDGSRYGGHSFHHSVNSSHFGRCRHFKNRARCRRLFSRAALPQPANQAQQPINRSPHPDACFPYYLGLQLSNLAGREAAPSKQSRARAGTSC
jgi:hypothetical protein